MGARTRLPDRGDLALGSGALTRPPTHVGLPPLLAAIGKVHWVEEVRVAAHRAAAVADCAALRGTSTAKEVAASEFHGTGGGLHADGTPMPSPALTGGHPCRQGQHDLRLPLCLRLLGGGSAPQGVVARQVVLAPPCGGHAARHERGRVDAHLAQDLGGVLAVARRWRQRHAEGALPGADRAWGEHRDGPPDRVRLLSQELERGAVQQINRIAEMRLAHVGDGAQSRGGHASGQQPVDPIVSVRALLAEGTRERAGECRIEVLLGAWLLSRFKCEGHCFGKCRIDGLDLRKGILVGSPTKDRTGSEHEPFTIASLVAPQQGMLATALWPRGRGRCCLLLRKVSKGTATEGELQDLAQ
mmetsp:Transcript_148057/g.369087  ORF Transcript_148057/g.369087 Transcript_148057/m.369087 type:complete len:357 (-) Transcript_148057:2313-3383(-)